MAFTICYEEKVIVAGNDLGANSFFRKPVRFSESAEAIWRLGLYWLVFDQPAPDGVWK